MQEMQKEYFESQQFDKMHDIQEILDERKVSHERKSKELQDYVEIIKSMKQSKNNISPKLDSNS